MAGFLCSQGSLAAVLAVPLAGFLIAALPLPGKAEAFGRWQQRPRSCAVEHGTAQALRCQGVQLDQRSPEVLRLSVQAQGPAGGELIQLTLVGALLEGQQPMGCRNGACTLKQPLQFSLSTLSLARFDGRGLAQSIPDTRPVQGTCRVDPAALQCEATGTDEAGAPPWTIKAQLR
jgi:hypothetical protein